MTEVAELPASTGSLPDGWRATRLGDVATLGGGTTPSRSEPSYWENATIPWATPSDITSLPAGIAVISSTESNVSNRAMSECSLPLNPPGTVLMTSRATIGFAAINTVPMATNQGFITFRGGKELDEGFLLHWLIAQRKNLVAAAGGSTFKELSRGTAKLLPILLPPLDEQRRIAEVLRSVDEALSASLGALEQARAVQSALITDLCFGHGYPMVSLDQILDDIRYGTSAKCDAGEENGLPVLRIPNVVNGRVEAHDLKYAVVSDADRQRYCLLPGDIVVVRTNGNPAYIGRSALIDAGSEAYLFASYLIRMRFDANVAWPSYVYAALNSRPVRELLLKAATTSAGNYNINTASLKRITIPLPDPTTQHQISEVIRRATDTVNAAEYEVESLRRMKAMLMSDLLSGHVRVPA